LAVDPVTGLAQATFTTDTLTLGAHTITAVYSGGDNFSPSDNSASPATVTIIGHTLALSDVGLTNYLSVVQEGHTATLSGTVSGLDGAACILSVDWGEGLPEESFAFAADTGLFTVSHYYDDPGGTFAGTRAIGVTVTSIESEPRTASATTSAILVNSGPTVMIAGVPGGFNRSHAHHGVGDHR